MRVSAISAGGLALREIDDGSPDRILQATRGHDSLSPWPSLGPIAVPSNSGLGATNKDFGRYANFGNVAGVLYGA